MMRVKVRARTRAVAAVLDRMFPKGVRQIAEGGHVLGAHDLVHGDGHRGRAHEVDAQPGDRGWQRAHGAGVTSIKRRGIGQMCTLAATSGSTLIRLAMRATGTSGSCKALRRRMATSK